jgi:phosphate acetyltransferase
MAFIDLIKEKARQNVKTIVLPESNDKRTLQAAEQIVKEGTAKLILLGNPEKVAADAKELGVNLAGVAVVDPANDENFESYVQLLYECRKAKGMTEEEARKILSSNELTYGVVMVKAGAADGMVAGACHSTADTLRPALQIIKTAPGLKTVSGFFIMDVPNCELGDNGLFLFADCAVNQNPEPAQLAEIATSSAKTFEALTGGVPAVAMLSHSSKGSAKHADVDKVVEATRLAKEAHPEINLDGELQLDAAIVPAVGESKAKGSSVAGHANVLVFPDLDAANIGYKLVQRLAKAEAYGPMLQGIAKPVNDLSRGCYAEDIVGVVAFTAVQAQMMDK